MKKPTILLFLILSSISFLQMNCKDDEPIKPCTDCPQPIDTTSHEFVWEAPIFLGDGASSALYDLQIIDDSLAYAVGDISVKDSNGNWQNPPYNIAKWNGHQWQLSTSSDIGYGYGELYCVFAFGPNDLWAGSTIPEHWDGAKWTFHGASRGYEGGFRLRKIWGTSSTNLYAVGDDGNIRHYNGISWQKIESGTNLSFRDIYGATDSKTGELQILALCSDNIPHERGLYRIQGNIATAISTYPLQYDLTSVWFVPNSHYYLVGSGMFEKLSLSDSVWKNGEPGVVKYVLTKIRGTGLNDVFAVGALGDVLHYNGLSWQSYFDKTSLANGGYASIAVKGDLVIAVGVESPFAATIIGRRKQ
ncbi:MAG: hypothetical protein Q8L88_04155 [Bacteroidota bacterium]|nr:hypothetical protein [Bacteroidota bacterium]